VAPQISAVVNQVDKLTLDTNIVRDWACVEGFGDADRYRTNEPLRRELQLQFDRLRVLRDAGRCEIALTSQIYGDFENGFPAHLVRMIGKYAVLATPSLSTFPIVFPTVFIDSDRLREILLTAFPQTAPEHRKFRQNQKDARQLYAHLVAGRDYFLTSDQGILRSSTSLQERFGIRVLELHSYLALQNGSVG
jgi:hypothetical protein